MSKEYLEAFERIKELPDSYRKQDVWEHCYMVDCEKIEQALQRLESIDNAEPSEAWKIVYNNFDYLISDVGIENDDVNICLKTIKEQLPTIKNALLKAQEHNYLKWEDLKFTNEVKEMKVKLGDNTYEIEYYICNALGLHQPVVILKTSDFMAITIEQLFNDLHFERVEE